ncbi:hypothetical protein JCM15519_30870 [Fundidesulfovibrio butyratiphilus]
MIDILGSTGVPDDLTGTPLLQKVAGLVNQDLAVAAGRYFSGFSARQQAMGLRQGVSLLRVPEVDLGALMDLGS